MENSSRFYTNHACEYFPCHDEPGKDEFNCLFCYCPLYAMGGECGGDFEYYGKIKDCSKCHLPHRPKYYDVVVEKLRERLQ